LCLGVFAYRDLRDYFAVWPRDFEVRHLYRADMREAAHLLQDAPLADVALTGRLALWDARAMEMDVPGLRTRWFNPESAMLYPADPLAPLVVFADPPPSEWARALIEAGFERAPSPAAFELWLPRPGRALPVALEAGPRWTMGLEFAGYNAPPIVRPGETLEVLVAWRAGAGYTSPAPVFPQRPIPPPQPYTTFVQVFDSGGAFVTGFDRFDASGYNLRPGDVVIQRYLPFLPGGLPPGAYTLRAGVYIPEGGARLLTEQGEDAYDFAVVKVSP
jgi:hypothetical protein